MGSPDPQGLVRNAHANSQAPYQTSLIRNSEEVGDTSCLLTRATDDPDARKSENHCFIGPSPNVGRHSRLLLFWSQPTFLASSTIPANTLCSNTIRLYSVLNMTGPFTPWYMQCSSLNWVISSKGSSLKASMVASRLDVWLCCLYVMLHYTHRQLPRYMVTN